jgi:hypothetical protein
MTQSKLITVPIKAKSSKTHPEVHLAYITDKEQDLLIKKDLYNSLKGKPNRGPGGLPSLEGDFGPGGKGASYGGHEGPDVSAQKATGEGGQKYSKTKGTISPKDHTGKVISAIGLATDLNPLKALGTAVTWGAKKIGNIFQQKAKGPTVEDTAAMEDAPFNQQKKMYDWGPQNGGGGNVTTVTQSIVNAPTADKTAGFGHQWNFQAYNQQGTTAPNVYDYTKTPYAKKGKLVRKYATGQEIKNFSKGKRFGPPPLKGPDPQGLQTILENSDYFKKLIG